ncbi:MAG TPA: hypothetical protein VKE41_23900 [Roseiflexaceae bacterium]|nr:hypothetical protein [Roseiflexaceae bacterium]
MTSDLDFSTFLAAPDAEVAAIAPATAIVAFGGTRRSAALAGVDRMSPAYMPWLRAGMLNCFDLLFRHGVRHIIAPLAIGKHLAEAGSMRAQLIGALDWGFAGAEALADYRRHEWRVRLIGTESVPELVSTGERLRAETTSSDVPTLWFSVCPDPEASLAAVLHTAAQSGARTRDQAVRALYGEAIPLATLLLGFGKPVFSYDLVPPLLAGRLQCYWMQRPGYALDQPMLRMVLYDYAYTRRTGSGTDRGGRYAGIGAQRAAWETDWVLGVGVPLGGFWFPAPFGGLVEQSVELDEEGGRG